MAVPRYVLKASFQQKWAAYPSPTKKTSSAPGSVEGAPACPTALLSGRHDLQDAAPVEQSLHLASEVPKRQS